MQFYKQIFNNLDRNILPKTREQSLIQFTQKQFPILAQQYGDTLIQYINGEISYTQISIILTKIKANRLAQMDRGAVRSQNYLLGKTDPVIDEIYRFQDAFAPYRNTQANYVPGTRGVQKKTTDTAGFYLG
ncbi:hypothetical protein K2X92_01275 [Candidatus Gracilibacteria bacterium]|nr:hypothetical protein [Candidatus Gracilibacteria bacterium]